MKKLIFFLAIITGLASCEHANGRQSAIASQVQNATSCTKFGIMYQRVSCSPAETPLPDFVVTAHYMDADEFKNLMPASFSFKQNGCESLDLSYIRKQALLNEDGTKIISSPEFHPLVHLGIGVDKAIVDQSSGLMFVARWENEPHNALMVMRSKNIGFGHVSITDTYGLFVDETGDAVMGTHSRTSRGFVRVLQHGSSNQIGDKPEVIQTCEYREFSIGH